MKDLSEKIRQRQIRAYCALSNFLNDESGVEVVQIVIILVIAIALATTFYYAANGWLTTFGVKIKNFIESNFSSGS